jgi:hypothetical protein
MVKFGYLKEKAWQVRYGMLLYMSSTVVNKNIWLYLK